MQSKDNFIQPVGSIGLDIGFNNGYQVPAPTLEFGNVGNEKFDYRHGGQFSDDNPAVVYMQEAKNKKDYDAAFERAVEWEIDRRSKLIQDEDARAVLAEQRYYDSPVNQIARKRAAGINDDVSSSGSGSSSISAGSSAQQKQVDMFDQSAQSRFKNAYDDNAEIMNGINTVSNVISSVTGFAGAGMDLAKTVFTWGDMLSQSHSATSIASSNAQAAESNAISAGLENALTMLNTAGQVSQMFGEDTPSSEIVKMLGGIGFSEAEQLGPVIDTVRSSPALQAFHAKRQLERKHAVAENDAAVFANLQQMYSDNYESAMYESSSRRTVSQFQQFVDSLAYNQSNAQVFATTLENQIQSGATSSELVRETVEHEINQFKRQLGLWQSTVSDSAGRVQHFAKLYKENPNSHNKALLDAARMNHLRICTVTSENMASIYDIMDNYSSMDYVQDTLFDSNGEPTKLSSFVKGRFIDYNNFVFSKNYDPVNGKLDLNAIIATASALFVGGKALQAGKAITTTKSSIPLLYGSNGSHVSTVTTKSF